MSAPSYKPVVACSLLATSVLYIGYLWFKHRQEETDLSSGASSPLSGSVPDFDQVQERLANIKRHRLDTLEEEPVTQETAVEATSEATETKPEVVPDLSEDNSKSVKVHFACTDIRYRHLEQQEEDLTVTIVEDKSEVATEMAVDDTVTSSVPDVMAALNDPLCGDNNNDDTSPASPLSYSSSPVKSESAQSKSSCDWSDLIEQDEKEMQVCQQ